MMNATAVGPSFGFTSATTSAIASPEYVYVGHSDEQIARSLAVEVESIPGVTIKLGYDIEAISHGEDAARAASAFPFYAASLKAEGLANAE